MSTAAGGGQEQAAQRYYIFHELLHSFPCLLNCWHNFRPNIARHRPMDLQTEPCMSSAMTDSDADCGQKEGLTGFCNTAVQALEYQLQIRCEFSSIKSYQIKVQVLQLQI